MWLKYRTAIVMVGATFAYPTHSKSPLKKYMQYPLPVDQSGLHLSFELFCFNLWIFVIYSFGSFNKMDLWNIADLVQLSGKNDKCSYSFIVHR